MIALACWNGLEFWIDPRVHVFGTHTLGSVVATSAACSGLRYEVQQLDLPRMPPQAKPMRLL